MEIAGPQNVNVMVNMGMMYWVFSMQKGPTEKMKQVTTEHYTWHPRMVKINMGKR